jgi:hypothetical protein
VHACVLLFLQFGKPKQVHVTCSKLPQVFVASTIVLVRNGFVWTSESYVNGALMVFR